MPVIVVGTEKNFAALRPRLTSGRLSTAAASEIAAAVRAANPHVDLDKLEPGTVLTIPPGTPNVSVPGDLSIDDTTKSAIAGFANAAGAALEQLAADARTRESEGRAERKALATALTGKELEAAGRKDKALGKDIKAAQGAIEAEDALATGRAAALKKAQAEWTGELDALKSLVQ